MALHEKSTRQSECQFKRLVEDIIDLLGPSSGIDSADVDHRDLISLMEAYRSDEMEWHQYALGDASRNYTRNLVDKGNGKSNLVSLVRNLDSFTSRCYSP